jgi:ABC-2 type transport system ATP-binding protein
MGGEPAVVVDSLVKRYGSRTVVDGVTLKVGAGELVAVLGPNGAGKTTTVEIIEGYRTSDGGSVRVLGRDPRVPDRGLRARVGLMLQEGGFDMRARPLETIRQYGRFHAVALDAGDLLERLGLTSVATTPYRRLSGGERQRLALAVALVGRPEVLILDEPTAGMDPEARASVRELISDLRDDGLAILLTSHDLVDVERLADRIFILVAGRVVGSGTPAELSAGLRPRLRFRLDRPLDGAGMEIVATAAGTRLIEIEPGRYEILDVVPSPLLIAAVAQTCAGLDRLIVESRTVGGSLEDAYLELVGTAAGQPKMDSAA